MAENRTLKDNVITAQTYIENRKLPRLPVDYTETELRKKFDATMETLRDELQEYDDYHNELDKIGDGQNLAEDDAQKEYYDEYLKREYIYLNRSRQPVQKQYDIAKQYADYLHEYGDEFAQLYHIKDNNEKYGNPEKLEFIEVDITDNGDMLTQDQYFKMRADRNERVKQLALHVKDEDKGVEYNIGMMQYNQPNMPPQIKMQLSFEDETLKNLDDEKLHAIFDFCDAHGLSVLDMEIRNFDGTLVESAIRDKISKTLAERKAAKEAEIAEANAKEYAAQLQRRKELDAELQNISLTNDGNLPEGVSEENITYDLPDEALISMAVPEGMSDGEVAVAENAPETLGRVNRLARGVATAAIPDSDVPDHLDEHAPAPSQETTGVVNSAQSVSVPAGPAAPVPAPAKKKDPIEVFEKFIKEGLGKEKRLSYWKTSTSWFGKGWTEFIIYDTEDKDNRQKDGKKTKDGTVKYTYSLKLFLNVDSNGVLHFAYRVPNHKKIDETALGGIVGQLKDLGYTAITFPAGMPKDDEKGMWRKAMGEKGIVPIGMSLDKSKAEGMLKAAKEKLSAEDYANYQYRLAKQMNKYNQSKGKVVSTSEQAFIDGLINTHRYSAFINAHNDVLKSYMKELLRKPNKQTGTSDKIAVYRTLHKLFGVYKTALDSGGNILNATGLTPEEKRQLNVFSNIPVNKLNGQQMKRIFDILYERQKVETYEYVKDILLKVQYGKNRGAKAADHIYTNAEFSRAQKDCEEGINQDLTALGIEEIKVVKATIPQYGELERYYMIDKPEYERTHPQQNASTRAASGGNAASAAGEEMASAAARETSLSAAERGAIASDGTVTRNLVQNKGQQNYH